MLAGNTAGSLERTRKALDVTYVVVRVNKGNWLAVVMGAGNVIQRKDNTVRRAAAAWLNQKGLIW